jgi:membrane protein
VIPGVVTAAVGLTLLQSLFRVYIALSDKSPTESALAGIVVLLTFLYFAGFTILLGCVVDAVFSNRSADVDVEPVIGGVPVDSAIPQIQATLDALEAARDEDDAEVIAGGESVSMPSPAAVRVQRGGDDTVRVELLWRQSSAADSADGGDDSPAGS